MFNFVIKHNHIFVTGTLLITTENLKVKKEFLYNAFRAASEDLINNLEIKGVETGIKVKQLSMFLLFTEGQAECNNIVP